MTIQAARRRVLDFLTRVWEVWFSDEWARVLPELTTRARRFDDTVARLDTAGVLVGVSLAVVRTRDESVLNIAKMLNRRHDARRDLTGSSRDRTNSNGSVVRTGPLSATRDVRQHSSVRQCKPFSCTD
ncbi:DUF5937 family protein [Solicola gregarius]|uniref:DUF5937 family protein n=1 Tax=Solicola gregarius TaxID=2908642 RepID=UPI0038CD61DD